MRATNLGDIIAFVATADTGSFAAAARELGLSRSAAAKAVGRLEARLGTRLINRTTRSLGVTDEGWRFHEQCSAVLNDLRAAEDSAAGRDARPKGLLRITAPSAYGRLHVMPVVRRFLSEWPDVSIELILTDRFIDIIEEGFDLAIRVGPSSQLPPNLVARVIARYGTVFCAAPSYVADHGAPETLESLREHFCLPYVSSRPRLASQPSWRMLSADGTWTEIDGKIRFMASGGETVLEAALTGMGIAYLPMFLVDKHIAEGGLVRMLRDQPTGDIPVFALYPTKRHLPAKVRAFIDALVSTSSEEQGS